MRKLLIIMALALPIYAAEVFNSDFESGSPTPTIVTNFSIDTGQACSPTQSYKLTTAAAGTLLRDSPISSIDGYTKIRIYLTAWPSTLQTAFVSLQNSGLAHLCQIQLDTDGTLNVAANGGTTDTSDSTVVTTGAWHVLQLEGDGSLSAGSDTCHGYLDSVEIGSGVTNGSWSSNTEHVQISGGSLAVNTLYVDDWVIDDATLPAVGSCGASDNKYKSVVINE